MCRDSCYPLCLCSRFVQQTQSVLRLQIENCIRHVFHPQISPPKSIAATTMVAQEFKVHDEPTQETLNDFKLRKKPRSTHMP